jgi:hypothetical protein
MTRIKGIIPGDGLHKPFGILIEREGGGGTAL